MRKKEKKTQFQVAVALCDSIFQSKQQQQQQQQKERPPPLAIFNFHMKKKTNGTTR